MQKYKNNFYLETFTETDIRIYYQADGLSGRLTSTNVSETEFASIIMFLK